MKHDDPELEGLAAEVARALSVVPAELVANAVETPECADPESLVALASGMLDEPERTQWMQHVGDCPRCLLGLDAVLDESVVAQAPAREPATSTGWRTFAFLAAAAVILFFVGRFLLVEPAGEDFPSLGRTAELVALARVEPLDLRVTRGEGGPDALARAQVLYIDGEFAACIATLESSTDFDATGELLHGSALLLEARTAAGFDRLRGIEGLEGVTAREAKWLAAQACLLLADASGARDRLEELAGSSGTRAAEARSLADELEDALGN